LAGKTYLASDLTLECTLSNRKIAIAVGVPILLFQILVPLFIFIALYYKKRHNQINKESISRFSKNFGYFYLDYSEKCYYWEFVRII
jgi:hypothetical protein